VLGLVAPDPAQFSDGPHLATWAAAAALPWRWQAAAAPGLQLGCRRLARKVLVLRAGGAAGAPAAVCAGAKQAPHTARLVGAGVGTQAWEPGEPLLRRWRGGALTPAGGLPGWLPEAGAVAGRLRPARAQGC
jgi:hypothetical protein